MKFLNTKKGFTLVEVMIVVVLMSILVVIAVPIYTGIAKTRRVDDCFANRLVVSNLVQQVMVGMMDNGKKQDEINMAFADPNHVFVSPANFPAEYASKNCFVLTKDADKAFTLGDIRGGYRIESASDYDIGCEMGYYLKRSDLESVPFYTYLANQEIPVCAFEESNNAEYTYYVFSDATVICDCPDCLEN